MLKRRFKKKIYKKKKEFKKNISMLKNSKYYTYIIVTIILLLLTGIITNVINNNIIKISVLFCVWVTSGIIHVIYVKNKSKSCEKKLEFIRKYKVIYILWLCVIIIIIAPSLLYSLKDTMDGWISFMGSYFGAIISSIVALIVMYIALGETKKEIRINKAEVSMMVINNSIVELKEQISGCNQIRRKIEEIEIIFDRVEKNLNNLDAIKEIYPKIIEVLDIYDKYIGVTYYDKKEDIEQDDENLYEKLFDELMDFYKGIINFEYYLENDKDMDMESSINEIMKKSNEITKNFEEINTYIKNVRGYSNDVSNYVKEKVKEKYKERDAVCAELN